MCCPTIEYSANTHDFKHLLQLNTALRTLPGV